MFQIWVKIWDMELVAPPPPPFFCASSIHAQHCVCFYLRDITVYCSTDMEEWICTEASECAEAMWGVCDSTKCK
jgi:hypothetical protein